MEQHTGIRNGIRTYWMEYTDDELRSAWGVNGQGHRQAVERGAWCVVLSCDEVDALSYSRLFIRHIFAIPTCCHYDGNTLSLYCGDAGSGVEISMYKTRLLTDFLRHNG